MQLDLFTEVQCPRDADPARRLDELLEQAEAADRLGFDGLWLAEIHFQPEFSLLSTPYVVLGAIAARTRRLRLGVAVNLLPVHHPLQVAEQAATLDVLSHGRAQFALGRGHVHSRVYEAFDVDQPSSRERMDESLEVVRAAWTRHTLEHHGRFFDFPEVTLNVRPVQQPHPPIFIATSSTSGVEDVARQGSDIFLPAHIMPRAQVVGFAETYWEGLRRHGHDPGRRQMGLNLPVHVAETTALARERARDGFMDYYRVIVEMRADYVRWTEQRGLDASALTTRDIMTFERLYTDNGVLADPPTAVAQIRALVAETGATRILCWMNMGSIPHAAVLDSMQRFAAEVAPALRAGDNTA